MTTKIGERRQTIAIGIVAGSLLYFGMRAVMLHPIEKPHSILFGTLHHFPNPWFVDLLLCCFYFVLIMHLLMHYDQEKPTPKFLIGYLVGFGCFGGMMGTIMGNWYLSFEFFFVGIVFAAGLITVFGSIAGVIFGVGWLCYQGGKRFVKTSAAQPVVRLGRKIGDYFTEEKP